MALSNILVDVGFNQDYSYRIAARITSWRLLGTVWHASLVRPVRIHQNTLYFPVE